MTSSVPLSPTTPVDGDTPALRLFSLLELIAAKDHFVSLQGLVEETGIAKPTLHRMLHQLEAGGLIARQADGRSFGTGARVRRFAEDLMLNTVQHGARHAVLRHLVDQLGETCNVTALASNEVIYLDRVETSAPLRFLLRPGSRVPAHASASGKMILSQMTPAARRTLLSHTPLTRFTGNTITDLEAFEEEMKTVATQGFAVDREEYMSGLFCIAVLVPTDQGRSNMCVATQAPVLRLGEDRVAEMLPALRTAAAAIADIDKEGSR
ncbi:IclR family transcriptional regulator [Calidifontibacter sp. DB0510]|uniref:IclR family transcriptional regulator n=1 Tax=Metallococcus carri TaxID=1656884 RepID=A0A967B2D0_9MICO|nr:IclR family transcriptional regulator [Metallococcus carri]NHN56709.1 IclR family transcriptional regulator [Metallococcus carri]NOP37914.1 IclR family transcriptional regulator [Calidifontibacter sp. DB2511S]